MKNPQPIAHGIQERTLDSWAEFHDLIARQFKDNPGYIFRGQANAKWRLKSSLDRLEDQYTSYDSVVGGVSHHVDLPPVDRDTHLQAFRHAVLGRPGVASPPADDNECWALAQHHGVATPMLDWTRSPFVALFFAFEEEKEDSEYRAVFALFPKVLAKKDSCEDPAPISFLPTNEASYRLLVQAGLFLNMPPGVELEEYIRSHFDEENSPQYFGGDQFVLMKILIANNNADRVACLKTLNKMNINRMTLFPDLDGAASYINALWEIGFDTSLGWIGDDSSKTKR